MSKLLRASGDELDKILQSEIEANPALESYTADPTCGSLDNPSACQVPWHRIRSNGGSNPGFASEPNDELLAQYASGVPALEQLAHQVCMLTEGAQRELVLILLTYLDEHGYLSFDPEALAIELNVELDRLQSAMAVLHELEPPGIGAHDARQCLLLQCEDLESEGYDSGCTRRILRRAWNDFLRQRWNQVARKAGCSLEQVKEAVSFLRRNCYLYPLSILEQPGDRISLLGDPDLIVHFLDDGDIYLEIPGESNFGLRVASDFMNYTRGRNDGALQVSDDERAWVRTHVDRAHLVIQALRQRWETMRRVGEYLLNEQRLFLQCGPRYLIPLTRAQVAGELGLSQSTVCRTVQDKILQLPDGRLIQLSDLFDHSLPIKANILDIMTHANHRISDREISERLHDQGYTVARRTVTKYRRQLCLHGSDRLRRLLNQPAQSIC